MFAILVPLVCSIIVLISCGPPKAPKIEAVPGYQETATVVGDSLAFVVRVPSFAPLGSRVNILVGLVNLGHRDMDLRTRGYQPVIPRVMHRGLLWWTNTTMIPETVRRTPLTSRDTTWITHEWHGRPSGRYATEPEPGGYWIEGWLFLADRRESIRSQPVQLEIIPANPGR